MGEEVKKVIHKKLIIGVAVLVVCLATSVFLNYSLYQSNIGKVSQDNVGYAITGTVYDKETKHTLEDVKVTRSWKGYMGSDMEIVRWTDRYGSFAFAGMSSNYVYSVCFEKFGYETEVRTIEFHDENWFNFNTVSLSIGMESIVEIL